MNLFELQKTSKCKIQKFELLCTVKVNIKVRYSLDLCVTLKWWVRSI